MNEFERRLRGKIRQNRREYYSDINEAVNLTTRLFAKHFEHNSEFLSRVQEESFKVLIMSTAKDYPLALMNAFNLLDLYPMQLVSIDIVMPGDCTSQSIDTRISVKNEAIYLQNPEIQATLIRFRDRVNWVKQQYIKMKYVSVSKGPVLIIDADTFLKRPIFLFSENHHTLLVSEQDFHYPYAAHARRFFNETQPLLNFVNHVQVQMPEIYSQIFPGEFDGNWIRWANLGRIYGEDSPVSEFQTYAGAVLNNTKIAPIFVSLIHETRDFSYKSLDHLTEFIRDYEGHLFTVGGKTLLQS